MKIREKGTPIDTLKWNRNCVDFGRDKSFGFMTFALHPVMFQTQNFAANFDNHNESNAE